MYCKPSLVEKEGKGKGIGNGARLSKKWKEERRTGYTVCTVGRNSRVQKSQANIYIFLNYKIKMELYMGQGTAFKSGVHTSVTKRFSVSPLSPLTSSHFSLVIPAPPSLFPLRLLHFSFHSYIIYPPPFTPLTLPISSSLPLPLYLPFFFSILPFLTPLTLYSFPLSLSRFVTCTPLKS
jgi:hypothetical protein